VVAVALGQLKAQGVLRAAHRAGGASCGSVHPRWQRHVDEFGIEIGPRGGERAAACPARDRSTSASTCWSCTRSRRHLGPGFGAERALVTQQHAPPGVFKLV